MLVALHHPELEAGAQPPAAGTRREGRQIAPCFEKWDQEGGQAGTLPLFQAFCKWVVFQYS